MPSMPSAEPRFEVTLLKKPVRRVAPSQKRFNLVTSQQP